MSGAHPNNGGRSAGVAYVDLAVGDSQALVAGVAKAGQTAAEAFMKVFQEAFKPAGVSDELANEIIGGATEAAKQAVREVNDALKGIGYEQLTLFDTAALVDQAAKAGSEAAKALTTPIEEGAAEAGKAAGTSVGEGVAQGAEEGSKRAGESIKQNVSSSAKSAGEESKSGILKSFEELKQGIVYSIGSWGLGYSIGNALFSGFNDAFSAIENSVFGFNSLVQQNTIALTHLLGGQAKAAAFQQQLQNFAANTPFQYQDLVPDAQRLLALGVKQNQILPTLTAAGDAVSAMGGNSETLKEVLNAMGEMESKGQVMEVQLRQLELRGIPALSILANEYGVTNEEMVKMVRTGKIMASDALPKIVDGIENGTKSTVKLGGAMADQVQTFQGSLSNIKDRLTFFAADAFKPVFGEINRLSAEFSGFLGTDQSGLISKIKGYTQDFITGGEAFVKGAIRLGDIAFSGLSKPVDEFLKPVFKDVSSGASELEKWLPKLAQDFNDIAKALLGIGKDAGLDVWRLMGAAVGFVAPLVKDAADGLAAVARNREAVTVAKGLLEVFLAFKAVNLIRGVAEDIGSRLVPVIGAWQSASSAAKTAFHDAAFEARIGMAMTTSETDVVTRGLVGARGAVESLGSSLGSGLKGAASGFTALLSGINPVVAGLTAATLAAGYFVNKAIESKQKADELNSSMMALGQAYKSTGVLNSDAAKSALEHSDALKQLVRDSAQYGISVANNETAMAGDAIQQRGIINVLHDRANALQALIDKETIHSRSGSVLVGDGAKHVAELKSVNDLTSAYQRQFKQVGDNANALSSLDLAQAAGAASGTKLVQADVDLISKLDDYRKGNLNAADSANVLKQAQDVLYGKQISVTEATQALSQSKINLTNTLKENKGQWDLDTQAGLNNNIALEDAMKKTVELYQAQVVAQGPSKELTDKFNKQIDALKQQAIDAGANRTAIQQLADQYGKVPDAVYTTLHMLGYTDAMGQLSALGQQMSNLMQQWGIDAATAKLLVENVYPTMDIGHLQPHKRADGGAINGPGSGTSDSIPAMLSNGEHVWTAKEVQAAGGHHAVEALRKSVLQGFATGGPVHHRVRHAVHLAHGVHHAFGAHHNVHAHHRAVHVAHPNAHHPRHALGYHPRPNAHHPRPGAHVPHRITHHALHHAAHHVKKFADGGPVERHGIQVTQERNFTRFAPFLMAMNAGSALRDSFSSALEATGGGQIGGWIAQAILATGVPMSWASGLRTLVERESGGNPRAINLSDINAALGHPSMGIAQTIMPTFEAYRLPGLPDDIFNPVSNLSAAIRYIQSRYGDIGNVQQANPNLPPLGYDNGGMLMPGRPGMNFSNKPEPVFTSQQWSKINTLVQRGANASSSGKQVIHVYFDGKLVDDRVEIKVEEAFDDLSLALSGGRRP